MSFHCTIVIGHGILINPYYMLNETRQKLVLLDLKYCESDNKHNWDNTRIFGDDVMTIKPEYGRPCFITESNLVNLKSEAGKLEMADELWQNSHQYRIIIVENDEDCHPKLVNEIINRRYTLTAFDIPGGNRDLDTVQLKNMVLEPTDKECVSMILRDKASTLVGKFFFYSKHWKN